MLCYCLQRDISSSSGSPAYESKNYEDEYKEKDISIIRLIYPYKKSIHSSNLYFFSI